MAENPVTTRDRRILALVRREGMTSGRAAGMPADRGDEVFVGTVDRNGVLLAPGRFGVTKFGAFRFGRG